MTIAVGIGLAFVAMLCWGFGDFLIQRSTRKVGDWETLFIITLFGAIVLAPFVWHSLPTLFSNGGEPLLVLFVASVVLFIAALLDLDALKKGKLAIVEPIWSFEIPAAAVLSFLILGEKVTVLQIVLLIVLMGGLMLVAFRRKRLNKSFLMEKGIFIALIAAIAMGAANFFMGWGGRVSDPVMVNFFTDAFLAICSGIYLIAHGRFFKAFTDLKKGYNTLLPMAIADKVAWVAFVFSMVLVPIAVATALSESYIIIAILLGLFVNKEKLQGHQKVGLVLAIIGAIVLAVITSS